MGSYKSEGSGFQERNLGPRFCGRQLKAWVNAPQPGHSLPISIRMLEGNPKRSRDWQFVRMLFHKRGDVLKPPEFSALNILFDPTTQRPECETPQCS
jgi:hypothetical protein